MTIKEIDILSYTEYTPRRCVPVDTLMIVNEKLFLYPRFSSKEGMHVMSLRKHVFSVVIFLSNAYKEEIILYVATNEEFKKKLKGRRMKKLLAHYRQCLEKGNPKDWQLVRIQRQFIYRDGTVKRSADVILDLFKSDPKIT